MSDFIYSSTKQQPYHLQNILKEIPEQHLKSIIEYHGEWGSFAVIDNTKFGYSTLETENYICSIVGNPLIKFKKTKKAKLQYKNEITSLILNRWKLEKIMLWDKDISGPFAILLVNKSTQEIEIITDIISFIPLYRGINGNSTIISTHIDSINKINGLSFEQDLISISEFIESGKITFPYTWYTHICQLEPASIYKYTNKQNSMNREENYWLPLENDMYDNVNSAATDLYNAIEKNIEDSIDDDDNIALFISGGEDSRFILGMLPKTMKKDAYVFLDKFNREGKIAKKATEIYGADFHFKKRNSSYYADILYPVSRLVGSGSEYRHVYSYGFHKECNLKEYDAIFGGLFSDAFLKGSRIVKVKGSGQLPFLPQIKDKSFSIIKNKTSFFIKDEVMLKVHNRQLEHYKRINEIRPNSADEWFNLWPISMNFNIPNLHGNRRLFNSYEMFMTNEIVKISARIPQEWKLNKIVFHKMARNVFKKSKYLSHASGGYPYFSWQINLILKGFGTFTLKLLKKLRLVKHEGPWGDWYELQKNERWIQLVNELLDDTSIVDGLLKVSVRQIVFDKSVSITRKMDILQSLYMIKAGDKKISQI